MEKFDLISCPFCGETPAHTNGRVHTNYTVECPCGRASVDINCVSLCKPAELLANECWDDKNFTFTKKIIDRAKLKATPLWNERAPTKNWRNNSEHKKPAEISES